MGVALERHNTIVRGAIEEAGGYVFATGGDGYSAAFARAGDAVSAALRAQASLDAEMWPERATIKVRVALHTGEVTEREGDYFGTPVNQVARLMALGHGGQIICSASTAGLLTGEVPLLDLGEHRLRDLSATQQVFQVGEGRFPALRSVDVVPGNLPTVLTELVGRREDIAALVELLEHDRFVTLTGVGGVGKTRLALAVAAANALNFPDGCWLAELAPAGSSDEVTRAVASAMGVPASDLMALSRFLADRRTLIVLDNCEHVLGEAADLAEAVLRAGTETAILATSREPLGVAGEVVRGVRSLTVPLPAASVSEAADAAAVRLFVARASSAVGGFVLDEHNVESVVAICRQLDGIPLAIELAAARVRGMVPSEIARRLGERFRLLAASRGSVERHRTLLGAVSWSHDLLSEPERIVFRRLGVFPASFDLAATEVVAGEGDSSIDVVVCVLHLVDRSLIVFDPATERYRLLETLREFATDRLAEAAETEEIRDRHAEFYLRIAGEQGDMLSDAAFRRIETELDNLRAVAEWLRHRARWLDLLSMCHEFYDALSSYAQPEAYGWYRTALDHLPDLDIQERIDALGELEMLAMTTGNYGNDVLAGASIALADSTGSSHSAKAWLARWLAVHLSDPPAAKLVGERLVAVAQERGDQRIHTLALGVLACSLALLGESDRSTELATETLKSARVHSSDHFMPGWVAAAAGSYLSNRVDPDFDSGMRVLQENPVDLDSSGGSNAYIYLRMWGLAHLGLGHTDMALSYLIRSLLVADGIGMEAPLGDAVFAVACTLAQAGQMTVAWQLIGYSEAHCPPSPMRESIHDWLQAGLTSLEAPIDKTDREGAIAAGTRLNRRGLMRLIAQVDYSSKQFDARPNS
jgi:predicted ATPase